MTRREQLEQAAIEINMRFESRLLDRLVAVGEWADANPSFHHIKQMQLQLMLQIAQEALDKIADPRKRDHKEPDKYTECGCMMNIAEKALNSIYSLAHD